jgi:hypothetical protein
MAEIRDYTMNFGFDMAGLRQICLRRNAPLKRRVAAGGMTC